MAEGVFQAIRWFRGLGREGRPNGIPWHSKRCGVQPHLEGIVWKENHSKHISKRCPGNKERLVYFMNQSLRRDITQVLLDEKEQRCGLSFVRWNLKKAVRLFHVSTGTAFANFTSSPSTIFYFYSGFFLPFALITTAWYSFIALNVKLIEIVQIDNRTSTNNYFNSHEILRIVYSASRIDFIFRISYLKTTNVNLEILQTNLIILSLNPLVMQSSSRFSVNLDRSLFFDLRKRGGGHAVDSLDQDGSKCRLRLALQVCYVKTPHAALDSYYRFDLPPEYINVNMILIQRVLTSQDCNNRIPQQEYYQDCRNHRPVRRL
ncbi:hypothetical protein T10_1274 [Trichinella papuae]|uniref:Uncharacterized protein n=1 Tax=Trichinella papuae TaxID=268474 RepID=A0A0V1M0D4_9BILA|nr:hypothetical protein T10_1274 [Trichinella papuae]